MDNEKMDHIALRVALAGALRPQKGTSQPAPSEMAHRIREWAESSFSVNPTLKLPDGFPLGESLLRDSEIPFCPDFFQSWKKKFGDKSLFSQTNPSVAQQWARRLVEDLKGGLSYRAKGASEVLSWVLPNAPKEQLDITLAQEVFETIEANRGSRMPLPPDLANTLTKELQEILGDTLDPLRPPVRWTASLKDLEEGADMSMPVRLPSGRVKPLKDWVRLRSPVSSEASTPEISKSTLLAPPHGRRLELARDWMLCPEISTEEARSRLWSATNENPASVWILLEWLKTPPKRSPHYRERISDIVKARDPYGRGYLAFLASGCSGRGDECEAIARHLLGESIFTRDCVYGEGGAGLVEQMLIGKRLGLTKDAFDTTFGSYFSYLPSPEEWVYELFGEDVYLGPEGRRKEIEDDLVDSMLPGFGLGHSFLYTKALKKAFPSEKVWQAQLWAEINRIFKEKFETHHLSRLRLSEMVNRKVGVVNDRVDCLVKSIESNPGILWIGEVEFAQFKTMIYPPSMEGGSQVPTEFKEAVNKGIERLERAVLFNSMHLEFGETPAMPSRRHRL